MNNDEQSKLGAVTLNTAIDMTQDFHFSWEVKISYSNYWDGPGDGIGFVLHPLYKPGEKITDLSSNNGQFLPTYFGRYINKAGHLVAVEDPNNLYNGQNLNSILNSSACPYGAFVTTNYNGYFTVDTSTYKQLKNLINIVNNQWWKMDVDKNDNDNEITVTISGTESNNPNKYVSVSKDISFIDNKTEYGFAILAATGRVSESNQIRNVEGEFTPAKATLVTRYTDENGTDLQAPKVILKEGTDNEFTNTNNQPTIYKDGKTYQCSQINGNLYDSTSDKPIIRQLTNGIKIGEIPVMITKKDDTLTVRSQYNSVIVLNYIYRQRLPSDSASSTSNSPITLGLKI